jgi:hypothetical protein
MAGRRYQVLPAAHPPVPAVAHDRVTVPSAWRLIV